MSLTSLEARLRLAIYEHFEASGSAPVLPALAGELDASPDSVAKAALRLHDLHAVVLAPDRSGVQGGIAIRMAHPFSGVETAYTVETPTGRYPVNCAWDALALPPLLGVDGICNTDCPQSGEALRLEVKDGELVDHGGVVHLAVPARDFWKDVGFT